MEKLDCKVEVRKYVLVTRPSRWNKRGGRVVVQSPVLAIQNTDIRIPVKRFNGEEANSVEFLPIKDIEKDASAIYTKERVSKTPVWVDAHGIAIADSSSDDELKYCRNDKFWIHVGASTSQYQTTVPVINLRTQAKGTVNIKNVCWYPKIQGPNEELWTLGGKTRSMKQSGSRKYTYFSSFVICQKLDGRDPTTRSFAEIPTKETPSLSDRSLLSSADQRSMFERRLESMLERQLPRYNTPSHREGIMTPPSSPDSENQNHTKLATTRPPTPSVPPPFGSIAELLKKTVEPSICRVIPPIFQVPRIPITSMINAPEIKGSKPDSLSQLISPTNTACQQQPYSRELSNFGGDEVISAQILCDLSRRITLERAAIVSREIGCLPQESCSARFAIMGSDSVVNLCDRGNVDCEYLFRFPFKHYHSPANKCQLSDPNHRHCVSQRVPLPEYFGGCLLMSTPSLRHECCYWKPEDRATLPPRQRYLHQEQTQEEADKRRRILCGLSSKALHLTPPATPLECENLTEAGRQLYRADCLPRSF